MGCRIPSPGRLSDEQSSYYLFPPPLADNALSSLISHTDEGAYVDVAQTQDMGWMKRLGVMPAPVN